MKRIWKVKLRELAVVLVDDQVSHDGGLLCGWPRSEGFLFSINRGARYPFLAILAKLNAPKSRCVVGANFTIGLILWWRRYSKVLSGVVQAISIPMINLDFWVGDSENHPMHLNRIPNSIWSLHRGGCVKPFSLWIPPSVPKMLHERFVIGDIDSTILTLRQRHHHSLNTIDDVDRKINRWSICPTLSASLGAASASTPTLRTLLENPRGIFWSYFVRLTSRLDTLLQQGHFSPPRELCGQAALGEF